MNFAPRMTPQLVDFPTDQNVGHIKFVFPEENKPTPRIRTDTVCRARIDELEVHVDFVLHEHGGPAYK